MPEPQDSSAESPTKVKLPRFGKGLRAPFSGLALWVKRGSLFHAGLPSLGIGIALTALIAIVWISQFSALQSWIASPGHEYLLRLHWWAVSPALVLGGISLGVLLLVVLGNLFASPWQSRLAQRTEDLLGADSTRQEQPASPSPSAAEAMLAELKRLGWLLVFLLVGLGLYFVPAVGALLYLAWFLAVLVLFLAYLFAGLPLRERGLSRWSKARFVWQHKIAMLGFGIGLVLLALIPLVQMACLPASAVGAVVLVRDLRKSG